jgi:hypothetical protein
MNSPMRSDPMDKETVLAIIERDAIDAAAYRGYREETMLPGERQWHADRSVAARATVEGLWEERERLQATLNNTLAERDAAEHVAQSSRISAIDAESRATRAEAALKEAGAWRPIAEAPRDGTWILLYDPGYKNPYLHAQFRRGAWWGQLTPSGRAVVWNAPPYWQPLPDAPQDVTDV